MHYYNIHYAVCAPCLCFHVHLAFDDVAREHVQLAAGSNGYKDEDDKGIPIQLRQSQARS